LTCRSHLTWLRPWVALLRSSPEAAARGLTLRFFAGLCACISLPLVLVAQWPAAPAAGLAWDLGNALGYLAVATCLLLFVYRGRPRRFPPFGGRFFAGMHRHLGFVALLLTSCHVGLLLLAEPLLLEHLKPSAPAYMLAGLLASMLLLAVVITSITAIRRRIWGDYHRFRWLHGLLGVACLVLIGWHVGGSAFYLNTPAKLAVALLALIVVLGSYRRESSLGRQRRPAPRRIPGATPHAAALSYGAAALVALLAIALLALPVPE